MRLRISIGVSSDPGYRICHITPAEWDIGRDPCVFRDKKSIGDVFPGDEAVSRRTMGIRVHKSPVPLGLNILAGLNSTNTISSRTLFVEYKRMDQFSLHTDVTNASYFTRSERPQDTRRRHSKKDTCKQVHYDVCRLTCSTPREISSSAVFGAGPSCPFSAASTP
jgi:hypothetical protein